MHSKVEPLELHLEATLLNINILNVLNYLCQSGLCTSYRHTKGMGSKRANGDLRAVSDSNQGFSGSIHLGSSLAGQYQ